MPDPRLLRAANIVGLPVVTIDGGEDVAEIKDVVYDGSEHALVGFTLKKRGFWGGTLPAMLVADRVAAIGPDAVMIDDEGALVEPSAAPDGLTDRRGSHPVIGTSAVSTDGRLLGTVAGVVIETGERPRAVGYEISVPAEGDTAHGGSHSGGHGGGDQHQSMFIPISPQLALSADNLVVPADDLPFMGTDLDGFSQIVTSFRSRSGSTR